MVCTGGMLSSTICDCVCLPRIPTFTANRLQLVQQLLMPLNVFCVYILCLLAAAPAFYVLCLLAAPRACCAIGNCSTSAR